MHQTTTRRPKEPNCVLAAKHKHERHLCLVHPEPHHFPPQPPLFILNPPLQRPTRLSNSRPTSLTPLRTRPTRRTRNRHRRHRTRAITRYRGGCLDYTPLIRLHADEALFSETLEFDGGFCCYGCCGTCGAGGRCCGGGEGCYELDWHEGVGEGEGEGAGEMVSFL